MYYGAVREKFNEEEYIKIYQPISKSEGTVTMNFKTWVKFLSKSSGKTRLEVAASSHRAFNREKKNKVRK